MTRRTVTVPRWIETPVCRRRVEIDVRDFLMTERALAAKYGVPWTKPLSPTAVRLAAGLVGILLGLAAARL
jgi:hypothetical protein